MGFFIMAFSLLPRYRPYLPLHSPTESPSNSTMKSKMVAFYFLMSLMLIPPIFIGYSVNHIAPEGTALSERIGKATIWVVLYLVSFCILLAGFKARIKVEELILNFTNLSKETKIILQILVFLVTIPLDQTEVMVGDKGLLQLLCRPTLSVMLVSCTALVGGEALSVIISVQVMVFAMLSMWSIAATGIWDLMPLAFIGIPPLMHACVALIYAGESPHLRCLVGGDDQDI